MSIADWLIARVTRRAPDFLIGGEDNPYIRRWWLIPRNRFCNVYLHEFLRSDDDSALHDHPYANCSVLLRGAYWECLPGGVALLRAAGEVVMRLSGRQAHRIELLNVGAGELPCWTLFITGPRYREWGFHCPNRWVPWNEFTAPDDIGDIGKGCNQ